MARTRQIGRAAIAARERMPSAAEADAASHAHYRDMLASELGPKCFADRAVDNGRPVSTLRLLLRPSGLFFVAALAFCAVAGIKLWQLGVFASLFAQAPTTVAKAGVRSTPGLRNPEPYVAADNAAPEFERVPLVVKSQEQPKAAETEADAGGSPPEAEADE